MSQRARANKDFDAGQGKRRPCSRAYHDAYEERRAEDEREMRAEQESQRIVELLRIRLADALDEIRDDFGRRATADELAQAVKEVQS